MLVGVTYNCEVIMSSLKSTLGLNNGDMLSAFVRAYNGEGYSDYSDVSNTDIIVQSNPVVAPSNFILSLNEDDQATFTWTPLSSNIDIGF